VEHTALNRIEQLPFTHNSFGGEGFKGQLTAGLLDDTVAPFVEYLKTDTTGLGSLYVPGCGFGLGGADVKECGSSQRPGTHNRRFLYEFSSRGFCLPLFFVKSLSRILFHSLSLL